MTPEKATSAIRSVKVMAAASVLALGVVLLFASSAAAAVEPQSKIFQLVKLDDIRQDADANAGDNATWKDIERSGALVATNTITGVEAENDSQIEVVQKAQSSNGQTTMVEDSESSTASIETGDASASNTIEHVHVNQHAEVSSQQSP